MTKRKHPTEHNVHWAWEFLRRNQTYRMLFGYWDEGRRLRKRLPDPVATDLRATLEQTGQWAARFRPWLESALDTGWQFITVHCFAHTPEGLQPLNDAGLGSVVADPGVLMIRVADRRLDPMNWCLNRWLDPDKTYPVGELKVAFDGESLIKITSVTDHDSETTALATLGLLTIAQFGEKSELSPFAELSPVPFGGESVGRSTLRFEIDLTGPLDAQFELLRARTREIKKSLGARSDAPEFAERKRPGYNKTYPRYCDLLDALIETGAAGDPTKIGAAYDRVKGKWPHVSSDTLNKSRKEAEFLRDHGYRQLAFLDRAARKSADI